MFWKRKPKVKARELTDDNFNDHVGSAGKPVLVDFWGQGCGPCNVMGPIVDELAREYGDQAVIAKVNVGFNPKLSQFFKIRSVPTIVIINQDKMVERFSGLVPKPNLEEFLDHYIEVNQGLDQQGDGDDLQA